MGNPRLQRREARLPENRRRAVYISRSDRTLRGRSKLSADHHHHGNTSPQREQNAARIGDLGPSSKAWSPMSNKASPPKRIRSNNNRRRRRALSNSPSKKS